MYTFAIEKTIGYKTDSAWSGIAFHPVSSYIGPPSMIAGRIDFPSIAFPIALSGPKTAWEHGINLTVGAPLLSTGPWEEPLLTVVADTLPREPTPRGARYHDVILSCCSRKSHMRRYGPEEREPGCHGLLSEAAAPFGIPPHYVDDTFNVFMRTGFANGFPFHEPSDAAESDCVELRAEKDFVIAIPATWHARGSVPLSTGRTKHDAPI